MSSFRKEMYLVIGKSQVIHLYEEMIHRHDASPHISSIFLKDSAPMRNSRPVNPPLRKRGPVEHSPKSLVILLFFVGMIHPIQLYRDSNKPV